MAKKRFVHKIHRELCKGCNICVHFCPKNVLELDEKNKVVAVRPQDCIGCHMCELRCPDFAIQVEECSTVEVEEEAKKKS